MSKVNDADVNYYSLTSVSEQPSPVAQIVNVQDARHIKAAEDFRANGYNAQQTPATFGRILHTHWGFYN